MCSACVITSKLSGLLLCLLLSLWCTISPFLSFLPSFFSITTLCWCFCPSFTYHFLHVPRVRSAITLPAALPAFCWCSFVFLSLQAHFLLQYFAVTLPFALLKGFWQRLQYLTSLTLGISPFYHVFISGNIPFLYACAGSLIYSLTPCE